MPTPTSEWAQARKQAMTIEERLESHFATPVLIREHGALADLTPALCSLIEEASRSEGNMASTAPVAPCMLAKKDFCSRSGSSCLQFNLLKTIDCMIFKRFLQIAYFLLDFNCILQHSGPKSGRRSDFRWPRMAQRPRPDNRFTGARRAPYFSAHTPVP